MKNIFKFFGVCAIMVFSFYYTEKIALYAKSQSPIMKSIKEAKDNLTVSSINAEVMNEYIIPGINGLEVNVEESFSNMKTFKAFNSYYLEFDQVSPDISLENNKNKIIINGNKRKKAVSIILERNTAIEEYVISNNIKTNILMNLDNFDSNISLEILNDEINNFEKLDNLLIKSELNKRICLVNNSNKKICLKKEYYLVKNNKELNSSNIPEVRSSINSGDIILIKKNAKLEDFKLLIQQIKYQDLNIVNLSELITEENN